MVKNTHLHKRKMQMKCEAVSRAETGVCPSLPLRTDTGGLARDTAGGQ